MPHFDYGDIVYQDLSRDLANKLQRIQNVSVRFIFNLRKFDHISGAFKKLDWIKLETRKQLHILTFSCTVLRTQSPEYLFSEFVRFESVHNCNTRGRFNLLIPNHRTETYHKSFIITATTLWNTIPSHIKSSISTRSFRRKCLTYLNHISNLSPVSTVITSLQHWSTLSLLLLSLLTSNSFNYASVLKHSFFCSSVQYLLILLSTLCLSFWQSS